MDTDYSSNIWGDLLVSHSSKQLNEKEQSNNDFPLLPQIDALNSKVRVEIFFLLNIFGELNLTQLSSMMNKSKPPTVFHFISSLLSY